MLRRLTRGIAVLAAKLAGILVGCGDSAADDGGEGSTGAPDVPDAEVRYETKYLDIAPLFDEPLCGGTLTMLDAHVESISAVLEMEPVGRVPVFLVKASSALPQEWCKMGGSCYRVEDGVVFARMQVIAHELVHAVTIGARGRSFWNEHVAHAFEGDYTYYLSPLKEGSEWDLSVWTNGHLVRWLIDWGGGAAFMDLFDATEPGASPVEVEAAFRGVYGLELSEALSEYAATAPYVYPDNLQCYVPDGTVEVPWDGDWWEHEIQLDCAGANTFTADDEISRMSARIPFSIAEGGKYRFDADHPNAEILIRLCIDAPLTEPFEDLSRWPQVSNPILGAPILPAGRYVLELSVPLGNPVAVRVQGYPSIEPQTVP